MGITQEKRKLTKRLKGLKNRELKKIIYDVYFPKRKKQNKKEMLNRYMDHLIRLTSNIADKKIILERDNYTCRICGESQKEMLEVHHLTALADGGGNSILNLITLCSPCHMFLHCNPVLVIRHRTKIGKIREATSKGGRPFGCKDKKPRNTRGYHMRWGNDPLLNKRPPELDFNSEEKNPKKSIL